jgi:hypothetical protein
MTNIENVMETLFARRAPQLPPQALAEVFDRLVWCLDDNGDELEEVRLRWLQGEDKDKAAIALAMTEVYPADSREELSALLQRVAKRWPELQPNCASILASWDEQFAPAQAAPYRQAL